MNISTDPRLLRNDEFQDINTIKSYKISRRMESKCHPIQINMLKGYNWVSNCIYFNEQRGQDQ